MDLTNRVVLITGGKRIGRVVAGELARKGADIALSYRRSRTEADATAADVRAAGRRAETIAADVGKPDECAQLIDTVGSRLGRLDVLINMASVYKEVPFESMSTADWTRNLDINLSSAFFCARAAVPHMRRQGGGRIINFADWLARSGRPAYTGFLGYYTTKAAVIALTEALALEVAGDRILVNAIAPGPILPPPDLSQEERDEVARVTPLGRWGGALEVAKAVELLIDSDFMTGETIRVDGGRHVR
jgi:NAD(P)-dependent dehydrogenase (short-subunit alcohol dehydrogenase family)